jgi:two-component system, chemotaxis family, CheB/CheR fusion protein
VQQKHLIDLSRDPIFVWDFDAGILEWNRGSEELYGYTRDEALGKVKERLLQTVVPGSSFAALKATLLKEGSWSGELRQTTKSGRELLVESRIELEHLGGRRLVLESTRDVTAREAAERRLRLLLNELAHRVRNTLAVIQAIARHTRRDSKTLDQFIGRFEGRLAALASAHTLLVSSDWKGADLAELARGQLAPYIAGNPDRLRLQGERLSLPADLATPLGLALHELATNAVKHGSLSVPSGTVNVSWTTGGRNAPRALKLVWTESGGPPARKPETSGFGNTLIDSVIPGAKVRRQFRPSGLVCTIELTPPEAADNGTVAQIP